MTPNAAERVQEHYQSLASSRVLTERFYDELFTRAPQLRQIFPADLSGQILHFSQTLDLVIRHLGRITAVDATLRELGAKHLTYGAQPQHYLVARDALLAALEHVSGPEWDPTLLRDWKAAINAVIVPMLRGAAVETAGLAQILSGED